MRCWWYLCILILITLFLLCVIFPLLLLESHFTVCWIMQWSTLVNECASFHSWPFLFVNNVQLVQRQGCLAPSHYMFAMICVIWCFLCLFSTSVPFGSLTLDKAIGSTHKCPLNWTVFIVEVINMAFAFISALCFYMSQTRK